MFNTRDVRYNFDDYSKDKETTYTFKYPVGDYLERLDGTEIVDKIESYLIGTNCKKVRLILDIFGEKILSEYFDERLLDGKYKKYEKIVIELKKDISELGLGIDFKIPKITLTKKGIEYIK